MTEKSKECPAFEAIRAVSENGIHDCPFNKSGPSHLTRRVTEIDSNSTAWVVLRIRDQSPGDITKQSLRLCRPGFLTSSEHVIAQHSSFTREFGLLVGMVRNAHGISRRALLIGGHTG
jgi:hypothetical protein